MIIFGIRLFLFIIPLGLAIAENTSGSVPLYLHK